MASANVLLPSLVKLHFPDRVGLMTSIYSTSLAVGLTAASVLTVPVSEAYAGWRSGLLAWAATAAIAAVPWVALARKDRGPPPRPPRTGSPRTGPTTTAPLAPPGRSACSTWPAPRSDG